MVEQSMRIELDMSFHELNTLPLQLEARFRFRDSLHLFVISLIDVAFTCTYLSLRSDRILRMRRVFRSHNKDLGSTVQEPTFKF